jgi:hypothetical protein
VTSWALQPERAEVGHAVDEAISGRLQGIEQRLSVHQNAYVRSRAVSNAEMDQLRHCVERTEFRTSEVQVDLEMRVRSVEERLRSRVLTLKQLREDKVKQQRANIRSRLQAAAFDQKDKNRNVDEAARDIQSLSYTIVECHSRMDRQWTEMASNFQHQLMIIIERIMAVQYVAGQRSSPSRRNEPTVRDAITTMTQMIGSFAADLRSQLEEMRRDRTAFENHILVKLDRLSVSRDGESE